MRKIKMAFAIVLSICLLTACGKNNDREIRQEVIDSMTAYQDAVDKYCEVTDLWFSSDIFAQARTAEDYAQLSKYVEELQAAVQEYIDNEDQFTKAEYQYIKDIYLEYSLKIADVTYDGIDKMIGDSADE